MDKIVFTHRVDLSFLKHGFVISKADLQNNLSFVERAISENTQIKILFEGNEYIAYCDRPSSTQRARFMFKAALKTAFQDYFKDCYYIDENREIKSKSEVVVNVQFSQIEGDTFEAKQIRNMVVVNIDDVRGKYQAYLDQLEGSFSGYVSNIDKKFVQDKAKELYDLPSAYFLTDPSDVLTLVEEIRNDPATNEKDKKASSRCPSCSLKKFAEYLRSIDSVPDKLPFDTNVVIETISATGLIFDRKFVQRYLCSLLTKPFVILSGLTGSGKTQLAMAFPKLICEDKSQYKLIPVGADWTNREQLLGYPNALRPGEYVMPDNGALQLILEASKPENQNKPYFLVLDEMNMSYVERYFADFLSAMESGEEIPLWVGNKEVPATISLPKNLFIIGTINVDETTYMFSPKVLDRANVIEFRINKEQMLEYLGGTGKIAQIENRAERAADFVATASKDFAGSLSDDMKETLISMFETLSKIQKEFGYRTAHEMSRFITICKCFTDMSDEEAIDAAMVQKLLPKIHGSRKKISPVLTALWQLCYKQDAVEIDTLDTMPALDAFKYPLTAEKIWRMYQIAQDNGFTSFAEA